MSDLLGMHADDAPVAFGGAGPRSALDLRRHAAHVASVLPEPTAGSHVVMVFQRDRYAFAAALLGAWARGHAVALPPNGRRESIWAVKQRPECVAMLHDTDAGAPHRVSDWVDAAPTCEPLTPRLPTGPIATVFTSGTTGEMSALRKTAEQLLGEAASHVEHAGLAGARFAATVPPGHIYGLLFGVLAPLLGGGAMQRDIPLHAGAIAGSVAGARADVLVTVPAHVRALMTADAGELSTLRTAYCSTAPLDAAAAHAFAAHHGVSLTEVFGSSETGGVATRRRAEGDAWKPLPEVSVDVAADGALVVDSPFAGGEPFRMADTGELVEGGFLHTGRADGVVKVGGRRVSLRAMEQALAAADGVEDVAVVAVPDAGGRGTQLLAAVVAPGWDTARVRAALSERFEPSTLPRRVSFVSALPREDNGKLSRAQMLRVFGLDANGHPLRYDVDWEEDELVEADGKTTRRARATVPKTYAWYDGHFPGYPVMAGAMQLEALVQPALRRAFPDAAAPRRFTRLKFLDRILPGDQVEVDVSWTDGASAEFRITKGETVCSSGRVEIANS